MSNEVLLISLYSMESLGGGERYTLDSVLAVRSAGTKCRAFAVATNPPTYLPQEERLSVPMLEFASEAPVSMPWRELLNLMSSVEVVWVHQYLSNSLLIDVVANTASDQMLLLTGEGHEPIKSQFDSGFQPYRNAALIEISQYAASRAGKGHQVIAHAVSAGIWASDLVKKGPAVQKSPGQICTLGRILPHKGIEHTVLGIPAGATLKVIGPYHQNSDYFRYLRSLPCQGDVQWLGPVPESQKWTLLHESEVLVASSCHRLYEGTVIQQPELLGLVIFEALAAGVMPITSDIPVFREVMGNLGLADLVYEEGQPEHLRVRIQQYWRWPMSRRQERLSRARTLMTERYLWDNFWCRVQEAAGLTERLNR